MIPFKCWGCNEYKDGEGTSRCLGCFDDKMPYELSIWNIKPNFYPQEIFVDIAQAFDTSVTIRLKNLTDRQATMLLQYTLLEMKQSDIAEYHQVSIQSVSETIQTAKEKARKG